MFEKAVWHPVIINNTANAGNKRTLDSSWHPVEIWYKSYSATGPKGGRILPIRKTFKEPSMLIHE